ncbi:hypothetical protein ACFQZE_06300 [Paenibacillus sp. GCM10027627]|uniref:hypothetical protein n=1 Tax=unclassified Paenibacillus TaxID=185978 RepID=UPI00362E6F09
MLNVKISIDNGNGKKAELEINEVNNETKLLIIQKVFNLFGVDTDVIEMTSTYQKVGDAYTSFFSQVDSMGIETKEELPQKDVDEIKKELINGLNEHKKELEITYKETRDQPEFVHTGIKIREDGTKHYRLHYKCIACNNKASHYIPEYARLTYCHKCSHKMIVYHAHPDGFPNRDTFGNFFRAGEFKDRNLSWSIKF